MASPAKSRTKKSQSAARQWKRSKAIEIEVPSGNVALVKRPGMEIFLLEGLLPDSLMPIINEAISKGKGLPPAKAKALKDNMNTVAEMMDTIDRVTARICVEPKVLWHKRPVMDGEKPVMESYTDGEEMKTRQKVEVIPEDERVDQEGVLYTDDIDFEDKSFLFQYAVGGTADLERFRSESEQALASVSTGDDVADTA